MIVGHHSKRCKRSRSFAQVASLQSGNCQSERWWNLGNKPSNWIVDETPVEYLTPKSPALLVTRMRIPSHSQLPLQRHFGILLDFPRCESDIISCRRLCGRRMIELGLEARLNTDAIVGLKEIHPSSLHTVAAPSSLAM